MNQQYKNQGERFLPFIAGFALGGGRPFGRLRPGFGGPFFQPMPFYPRAPFYRPMPFYRPVSFYPPIAYPPLGYGPIRPF